MEKKFFTAAEVAEMLGIAVKTLRNRAVTESILKPSANGRYHVDHAGIIEKYWADNITANEGLAWLKVLRSRARKNMPKEADSTNSE